MPVFKELGVNEGNSIICNLEMSNVDLNRLKQPFKFKYEPPKSNWDKYLDNNNDYNPNDYARVSVKRGYTDIVNNKHYTRSNEIIENEITKQRASYLEGKRIDRMVILVCSCDKDGDLFEPFHHCIEKYYPEHPEIIYATETIKNPYYKNNK